MGRKRLLPGLTVKDGFMRHPFDIEHHVQTSGLVHGRDLTTGHANDKHNTAYYGIAPSVLIDLIDWWRATQLVAPPYDYTFLDLGAGMGRGMLVASRMPFREVIGVEIHPDLAAIAQKNIRTWELAGRARCPLRIVEQDVTEYQFPAGPCVAYLFNPFREPVLRALLKHLEQQFAGRHGQLDLLYANDEFEEVLAKRPGWQQLWRGLIPLSKEDEAADRDILNNQPDGEYTWSTDEPCAIYRWMGKGVRSDSPRKSGDR
jgi:hypothetical protein